MCNVFNIFELNSSIVLVDDVIVIDSRYHLIHEMNPSNGTVMIII